ncbi:hypothetical protein IKF20_03360 [Candidatus Saccharibacteria bacterium]|nr:hypothetical protein [Candidatus Saccharibacteria bacterium]
MSKRQLRGFCKTFLGVGAGVFASALFASSLASAVTYQDSVDVSFTFNPSISVDLSTSELVISELTPGTSADSNALTVSVSTNSAYGYYLTATAGTSSTSSNLVNSSNNNYVFSSIATNADLSALAVDNTWGYRTSSDNGTTWSNYSGLPRDNNDNGETGKALIETNAPTDSRTLKFKIGAKASADQAAGTYTNTINFYAVAHEAPEPPVGPDPPVTCNTPVPNITYMQDITSSNRSTVLASLTEEAPYYLRDSRDNEPYCVSKLKDGNLWLLDNLRLDLSDADTLASVAETNTNASATSLGYLKNGGGTSSDKYAITGVVEWTDSPTYASDHSYSDPLIATSGSGWSKDTTTTSYGNGSGKIGVYYNYCAASAGSYCYPSSSSTGDATEDLCPAGWRMPTGSTAGEHGILYNIYNTTTTATDTASLQYNLSTPLSGCFYSGSAYNQGTYGFFWSSTRYDNSYTYYLYAKSSAAYPTYNDRSYGRSIRCVLK